MSHKDKLSYIILGLLKTEALSGYDLKKKFENEVGEFWQANLGQIYPSLRVLLNDQAVTFDVHIVGEKLEKKTYQITEKGIQLFNEWLEHPVDRYPIPKDEFMLRLYFLDDENEENFQKLIEEEITIHQKKLDALLKRQNNLFEKVANHKKTGHYLVLDFAIKKETLKKEWLNSLLEDFK